VVLVCRKGDFSVTELGERRILLRALRDGIDTATSTGHAVAAIMATLAELELKLGRERRAASRESRRTQLVSAHAVLCDRVCFPMLSITRPHWQQKSISHAATPSHFPNTFSVIRVLDRASPHQTRESVGRHRIVRSIWPSQWSRTDGGHE